jgi:hypothetical protein
MMYYNKFGLTDKQLSDNERELLTNELKDTSHMEVLFEGGLVSEKKLYDELQELYQNDFQIVFDDESMKTFRQEGNIEGIVREKYKKTIELMKKGVPLIGQGVMINDMNHTYGFTDLLIRSDYMSILFNHFTVDEQIGESAPLLGNNKYHYRVIDYKWTTMTLCVDGVTIRNSDLFPAYKGQLAVYTACLGQMQGYIPRYAYVMSKAWKIDKNGILPEEEHLYRGFSCFDRPGIIDYGGRDKQYVSTTKDAIKWIHQLMFEGDGWRYHQDKPSVPEMYPNMSKNLNPAFDQIKTTIADRYGELTRVWYVDHKNRKTAHQKGVTNCTDPNCTTKLLELNDSTRSKVIQQILDINYSTQKIDTVRPKIIKNNLHDWQTEQIGDCFVDFETINYNLYVKPKDMDIDNQYIDSDVTFMIGCGFRKRDDLSLSNLMQSLFKNNMNTACAYTINNSSNTEWEFVCLYLKRFTVDNEVLLFCKFFELLILLNTHFGNEMTRLFHWTGAELRFLQRAQTRIDQLPVKNDPTITPQQIEYNQYIRKLSFEFNNKIKWVDLCDVFQKVPIVVKGCYRFKLKHVANAFQKHGHIKTKWKDGGMSCGFKAMLEAIKLYREGDPTETSTYREIIEYNEIDCKVMWEIIEYLRNNHC